MNQSKISKKDMLEIIDWLIDNFPSSFAKKGKNVKPLKIGIYEEIIDFCARLDVAPFSHKKIRDALNYYSSSPAYLKSQQEGIARVDIYGNEIDIVTKEQAKYSFNRYQQRYGNQAITNEGNAETEEQKPSEENGNSD